MSCELVQFRKEHAHELIGANSLTHLNGKPDTWEQIENQGRAFSGLWNGSLVICGGLIPQWSGRAALWSILSKRSGPAMFWIHKQALRYLEDAQEEFRRLEMTVSRDFPIGHKWAYMLGFKPEGLMRKYGPDGKDHVLFARVV